MSIRIGENIISGGSGSAEADNISITRNPLDKIQTVGVIDTKTGNSIKEWTGTLAEYNEIINKDNNTTYYIIDDIEGGNSVYTKAESDALLSHKLNDNQITNCITEIPQDIKLELNSGVLKLKAGSKVYIPNGFESDGTTKKFDEVTVESDISATETGSHSYALFYYNNTLNWINILNIVSGATHTSSTWQVWYDTTTNKIKFYRDDATTPAAESESLPLCIFTSNGTQIISIDQVFDVFGYIGSAIFSLPGVSFMCPNGRNADGTLNNYKRTSTAVGVYDGYNSGSVLRSVTQDYVFFSGNANVNIWATADSFIDYYPTPASNKWWRVYDTRLNKLFYSASGAAYVQAVEPFYLGTVSRNNNSTPSKITDLVVEKTFQAQDHYDTGYMTHQAMPSNKYTALSLGATGTEYTAPADGYFSFRTVLSGSGSVMIYNKTAQTMGNSDHGNSGDDVRASVPVAKGQTCILWYVYQTQSESYFRFVYAEGSK